ncbi:MAG: hypothetical protein GY799_15380, partial [Desulfobulbaceae bacterium]|nr:hypothetical protein [Desulfobulbaceae bacterium]
TINNDTLLSPTVLEKLILGQTNYQTNEGDTTFLSTNEWNYSFGLDTLINLSPQFSLAKINDTTYALTTNDPNLSGNQTAQIKSTANKGTNDTTDLNIDIANLINVAGQLINNREYKKWDPATSQIVGMPGFVDIEGARYFTDAQGNFSAKITPTDTIEAIARAHNGTDTLSFGAKWKYDGQTDQENLLLHVVPWDLFTADGVSPDTLHKFADLVNNDATSGSNFYGAKIFDLDSTYLEIRRDWPWSPDTMSVQEQDNIEYVAQNVLYPNLQIKPQIVKVGLGHPVPSLESGIIVAYRAPGPAGANATIHNPATGELEYGEVFFRNASTIFNGILKELVNAHIMPNELNMPGMEGKTCAHRTNGTDHVTASDYEVIQMIFNHYTPNTRPKQLEEMLIR